jgi:hypothetical protein
MQPTSQTPRDDDPRVVRVIVDAADRHDVPRQVALAFAWCESRLRPDAEGDLRWHERDGGTLYRSRVRDNPRYHDNPARLEPMCWHSYGLFQLLACFHALPHERPEVLLDPEINADRGCAEIHRLLFLCHGDVRAARLKYVGCGFDGSRCRDETVANYVNKLERALARYAHEGTP